MSKCLKVINNLPTWETRFAFRSPDTSEFQEAKRKPWRKNFQLIRLKVTPPAQTIRPLFPHPAHSLPLSWRWHTSNTVHWGRADMEKTPTHTSPGSKPSGQSTVGLWVPWARARRGALSPGRYAPLCPSTRCPTEKVMKEEGQRKTSSVREPERGPSWQGSRNNQEGS